MQVAADETLEELGIDSLQRLQLQAELGPKPTNPTETANVNALDTSQVAKAIFDRHATSRTIAAKLAGLSGEPGQQPPPVVEERIAHAADASPTRVKPTTDTDNVPHDTNRETLSPTLASVGDVPESRGLCALVTAGSLSGLKDWLSLPGSQTLLRKCLAQHGGVLLRCAGPGRGDENGDERPSGAADFCDVLSCVPGSLCSDYVDGISPRTVVHPGIFTSTEYSPQHHMSLHNEMSYCEFMPSHVAFFCQQPPSLPVELAKAGETRSKRDPGGQTPIADSQAILKILSAENPDLVTRFRSRGGITYTVNSPSRGEGAGRAWQDVYQTESKTEVQRLCESRGVRVEWFGSRLRTTRTLPAIRPHPVTGTEAWCNHAHLFHPSDLPVPVRTSLSRMYPNPHSYPKHATFGDGSEIPETDLATVRTVLDRCMVLWDWQRGDILLLDNMRVCHGRRAFQQGKKSQRRRILAALIRDGFGQLETAA